ncbi:MAG: hypothetical protein GF309_16595 [Candidatus Lokiarchaeota archaeon]|nr:hypothetical protein [Candidatus Lokiarchaeota archaeon]
MVTGYKVSEDGTLQEQEITKDSLDSGEVFCVVDGETKSIFLWKGSQAGIRRKFIGARVATNLRSEYGFHFSVRPLDEGEEPPPFFVALEGEGAKRVKKPGVKTPPKPKKKPKDSAKKEPKKEPEVPSSKPAPPPKKVPEKRTHEKPPTPPPTSSGASTTQTSSQPKEPAPVAKTATKAPDDEIQSMIEQLKNQSPPEGYERELVIIYNELYTVAEKKTSIFGKEKIEHEIEKVKDPPEGTFMAEGFIPRVIVKDGTVLGIELLKGTPDAILSPIKVEMKERLGDLITFFKEEVEEETAKNKKAGSNKGKKKLVAK